MRLEIHAEKCTGCRICQSFCSFHHEQAIWPALARVAILMEDDDGPFEPNICRQCDDAPCAASCPVEAISLREDVGAWVVDFEACIGCGSCVEACPYGAIFLDEDRGIALKCDLCGGSPECVEMCPTGAIVLATRPD